VEQIVIWQPLQGDLEGVRNTFRQRMQKLYQGWSDTYDAQWDKNSFLFALKDDDEYLATCRVIIKKYHSVHFKTPMEEASIQSFSLEDYHGICIEAGMLSFKTLKSFGKLMYHVGGWLLENNFDHVFTCYDLENPLIKRLYVEVMNFEEIENALIIYEGFNAKKTNEEVTWQVVKLNNELRTKTMDTLRAYSDCDYQNGVFPTIKSWMDSQEN